MVHKKDARAAAGGPRIRRDGRGRRARHPGAIPLLGWRDVVIRLYHAFGDNNLSIIAAGVSFYGLLAIFPGIAAFVALYGLIQDPRTVVAQMQQLSGVVPPDVINTITGQMTQVAAHPQASLGFTALATLALALWSARRGTNALMVALNVVYGERESRGLIRQTWVSLVLTLAIVIGLMIIALAAAGPPLLLTLLGFGFLAVSLGRGLGLALAALCLMCGVAALYGYAPSRRRPRWRWVFVGALLVTIFWILGSLAFTFYLAYSHGYSATYGSIGAVVVVLTWMYITVLIMLVVGELNAQLEFQTARDTTAPVLRHDRPLGQRDAFVADNVAKSPQESDDEPHGR
jgi:membrane protein